MKNKNKISFVSLDELIEKEYAQQEAEDDSLLTDYPDELELDFNNDPLSEYTPESRE